MTHSPNNGWPEIIMTDRLHCSSQWSLLFLFNKSNRQFELKENCQGWCKNNTGKSANGNADGTQGKTLQCWEQLSSVFTRMCQASLNSIARSWKMSKAMLLPKQTIPWYWITSDWHLMLAYCLLICHLILILPRQIFGHEAGQHGCKSCPHKMDILYTPLLRGNSMPLFRGQSSVISAQTWLCIRTIAVHIIEQRVCNSSGWLYNDKI